MSRQHDRAFGRILVLGFLGGLWLTQAFAGSREVNLDNVTTLSGTLVPPGVYTLVWKDHGDRSSVEVTIRRGKTVLAATTATRVQMSAPASYDGIVVRPNGNGTRDIIRIVFAGEREAIEVDPTPSTHAEQK